MIIYLVTCKLNEKKYVGQIWAKNKTIKDRWKAHVAAAKRNEKTTFHSAIREFGADNFVVEVIDSADNRDELNEKERFWIKHHETVKSGYNSTFGGSWYTPTIESKIKASKSMKEHYSNPAARVKTSETVKAAMKKVYSEKEVWDRRYNNDDIKEKQSLSANKRWQNTEQRKEASETAKRSRRFDEDIRSKIKIGVKKSWTSERRRKASEERKLRFNTPIEKQKFSERMRAFYLSSVEREKQSARMKLRYSSLEERAKTALGTRRQWAVKKSLDGDFVPLSILDTEVK